MIYSTLNGITSVTRHADGTVEGCMLEEKNILHTACGDLVPKYEEEHVRRKNIPSVAFYPSGSVHKISLNEQSTVQTPIGEYPAEFVTFYETGELQRIFPCNGQLSGYWSQQDEETLCPRLTVRLDCGAFEAKLISIHFYRSGAVRSVTLWPGEQVLLRCHGGLMPTRIGFALYEDGTVESVEPPYSLQIATPIGVMHAFDPDALGITADRNSLSFYPDGALRSLKTDTDQVEIIRAGEPSLYLTPLRRPSPLDEDETIILPLQAVFRLDGKVALGNDEQQGVFDPQEVCFRVLTQQGEATALPQGTTACGGDCSACFSCG